MLNGGKEQEEDQEDNKEDAAEDDDAEPENGTLERIMLDALQASCAPAFYGVSMLLGTLVLGREHRNKSSSHTRTSWLILGRIQ